MHIVLEYILSLRDEVDTSMAANELKQQVLKELATSNRLIADVAQDHGLTHRTIYAWIKSEQNAKSKRAKAIKVSRLKTKLAELNDELQELQVA